MFDLRSPFLNSHRELIAGRPPPKKSHSPTHKKWSTLSHRPQCRCCPRYRERFDHPCQFHPQCQQDQSASCSKHCHLVLPDAAPGFSNLPACTNGYHRFVYLDFYALEPHLTKRFNRKRGITGDKASRKVGTRSALYILLLIYALILIREAFSITTVNNAEKRSNGHFWYPLIALSEILAVV